MLRPGAEIADGFVVADGTTVPGGAFPSPGVTFDGDPSTRSWLAVVQSDLELPEVLAAYVQQAIDLGYSVPGFPDGVDAAAAADAGCWATLAEDYGDQGVQPPEPPVGTPLLLSCSAMGEKVVDGQLESVEIKASRSYPDLPEPVDRITLDLVRWPPSQGTGSVQYEESPPSGLTVPELPAPPPVTTMPEMAAGSTPVECSAPVRIEPGSQVLGVGVDCSWSTYDIVTEVTGQPFDVFAAYVEQLGTAAGFNPPVHRGEPTEFNGRQALEASVWGDDSSFIRLTMLTGGERPAVLRISHIAG